MPLPPQAEPHPVLQHDPDDAPRPLVAGLPDLAGWRHWLPHWGHAARSADGAET